MFMCSCIFLYVFVAATIAFRMRGGIIKVIVIHLNLLFLIRIGERDLSFYRHIYRLHLDRPSPYIDPLLI